jgi:UDP-N-acetylmuramoyl-tripeptide--D-alanyl-D-alanine ligase
MIFELFAVATALGITATVPHVLVTGWSIDSRSLQTGDLFFALKGPNHDGHQYVEQVLHAGAAGAVVEKAFPGEDPRLLKVDDTLAALQQTASWARSQYKGTVIGVTGSAGKTSTKDVIAALLSTSFETGKTVGNFNNHFGLPLSILRLPGSSRAAVLELGMNHGGEIRDLSKISRHEIAIVTNVGSAHIENFDSIDGIAAAKRELVEALPPTGVAVLNADDQRVVRFAEAHPGRSVTYGIENPAANVRARNIRFHQAGGVAFEVDGVEFNSSAVGRHSILNLLAGIAVAREFGIEASSLQDAVRAIAPGKMRGEKLMHRGVLIWNDCYNSNPDAAKAMLDVLRDTPANRRIAVLGEMLELGRQAEPLHREVGEYAAMSGVSVLMGVRGAARFLVDAAQDAGVLNGAAYLFFETPEEAGDRLREIAREGDAILFKGSRGTQVERALQRFMA